MIPFIEKLDFKKNERNKSLMINDKNNVMSKDGKSYTNIFALGDCAFNPNSPLPPTAQVAQQQAYWLCKEMNKMKNRKDFEPFKYVHKGTMAYIGGKDALVDTKYGSFSGISGWLFWNSVYLSKQFSLKNKISVPVHWGINHLLGRNMCQF
ncbi:hypothetical protein MHBO_003452 [Bonamia ostreae]|uniref:NADH:ubiquinone reductase (non-electrogenic) n=1 Tax=Bonamia ostreae TaxID=126728 RepID=A0ABV2AQW4_9EUKA